MTINFNFKKYIKYIFIAIVCILFFNSCNVKALNYVNPSYRLNLVLGGLDLNDLLYAGNGNDLANFYYDNFNTDFGENYVNDVKDYVINTLNYNSFSDFENDYYYIISYRVWDQNNAGYSPYSLSANMFYVDKSVGTFDIVLEAYSIYSSIGSSNAANFRLSPSINDSLGSAFVFNRLDYNGTYNFTGSVGTITGFRTLQCSYNYTYCRATKSNGVYNAYFVDYFETSTNRQYFDSNFEFDFVYDSSKFYVSSPDGNYYFTDMTINNTETIYNFGDKIGDGNAGSVSFTPPNIVDLGNNSYGYNFNSISNIFLDFSNNTSTTINCPSDRDFLGNVCYLYSSDIENFDNTNTNVSNSALFFLGGSTNLSLNSNKYYVMTFRVYTSYNLDILTTIYNFTNDATDYPFNIINKYYQDYTLYKDYSIVFQPTHTGTGYIQFINIVFNTLDNFTNQLNDNFSFGIFKSVKLSQYDNVPSLTDIQNENSSNSLDSISNSDVSSFFNDFRLNDHGLSSIVLYPFNFVSSFTNYTCSPLNLPLPRSMGNFQLPCVSSFMEDNFLPIWNIFKLVFNGFIIYRILINLYSLIKNSYKPDNDRIEVVDL